MTPISARLLVRSSGRRKTVLVALVVALHTAVAASAAEVVAVRVGRVITVSGSELERATILIRAGRIAAIGQDVDVPTGAQVWEFPNGVAMPGIVNGYTSAGLRTPGERLAEAPFVTVLDGIDPSAPALENSLRDGITTLHVLPSSVTRLSAQGAIIRPLGRIVEDMALVAPASIGISLDPPPGETPMGNMAALRRRFVELSERMAELSKSDSDAAKTPIPLEESELADVLRGRPDWSSVDWKAISPDRIDEKDRELTRLVQGELRAFIVCPRATDVYKAFELIDANGLRASLVLGEDAWKAAGVLARREGLGPVFLDPRLEAWEEDEATGAERLRETARILHDAGVRIALRPVDDGAGSRVGPAIGRRGEYHLWHLAAQLVAQGIPRAEAIRAITLTPAEALGLADRLGSLDVGKDGDVAVFSGDPLDVRSQVELVLIEGEAAYRRSEDADLELLLEPTRRRF